MERFTFFYEMINVFRKIDYVSSYFNEILGPNHSYMKWAINGPFGTEHVKPTPPPPPPPPPPKKKRQ